MEPTPLGPVLNGTDDEGIIGTGSGTNPGPHDGIIPPDVYCPYSNGTIIIDTGYTIVMVLTPSAREADMQFTMEIKGGADIIYTYTNSDGNVSLPVQVTTTLPIDLHDNV